jgi:hypothetical protein
MKKAKKQAGKRWIFRWSGINKDLQFLLNIKNNLKSKAKN